MKIKIVSIAVVVWFIANTVVAQTADEWVKKVKVKLDMVNDYVADGKMKTDVVFIKAPIGSVKIYYKKPNKLKLIKDKGISILPKGGITINNASLLGMTDFMAIDAGTAVVGGIKTKVIRLLPNDMNNDIALTTLYIDTANLVIKKTATTTKENGSFETEMFYGSYIKYGLPDKMIFSFNVKNYKMPKGITLDFSDDEKKKDKDKTINKKGRVEFTYTNYSINKGVDDSIFNKQ